MDTKRKRHNSGAKATSAGENSAKGSDGQRDGRERIGTEPTVQIQPNRETVCVQGPPAEGIGSQTTMASNDKSKDRALLISAISLVVAVTALIVNTCITVLHNSWQTLSTQHHDELSVSPHLDVYASSVLETPALELPRSNALEILVAIENDGIGPAIIDRVELIDSTTSHVFHDSGEWVSKNNIDFAFLQVDTPILGQYIKEGRRVELLRVVNILDFDKRPVSERQKIVSEIHDALSKLKIVVGYHSMYGIGQAPLVWTAVQQGTISPRIMDRIKRSS